MLQIERPVGVAIILCDHIITEAGTNKKTLVGTFNNVSCLEFPHTHHAMSVFVVLASGRGGIPVELVYKFDSESRELNRISVDTQFPTPNHVCEIDFNLRQIPMPWPGAYSFEIMIDDEIVLEKRFNVCQSLVSK